MSQHWEYLTARENQRQVILWTVAAVAVPAAGAFLWWLSEKSYNNLAPYKVCQPMTAKARKMHVKQSIHRDACSAVSV